MEIKNKQKFSFKLNLIMPFLAVIPVFIAIVGLHIILGAFDEGGIMATTLALSFQFITLMILTYTIARGFQRKALSEAKRNEYEKERESKRLAAEQRHMDLIKEMFEIQTKQHKA